MRARARALLGENAWQGLALFALDAASAALGAARWLASIFTVWCDPFGRSRTPIRLRGRCLYSAFRVAAASSERKRRIVSWFYRWHEAPGEADWRACLALFRLGAPPEHTLHLEGGEAPLGAAAVSVRITLAVPPAPGLRSLQLRPLAPRPPPEAETGETGGAPESAEGALGRPSPEVSGPTPIGGLAPESFVRALFSGPLGVASAPGRPSRLFQ